MLEVKTFTCSTNHLVSTSSPDAVLSHTPSAGYLRLPFHHCCSSLFSCYLPLPSSRGRWRGCQTSDSQFIAIGEGPSCRRPCVVFVIILVPERIHRNVSLKLLFLPTEKRKWRRVTPIWLPRRSRYHDQR